jgi:hypothetical protein
MALVTCGPFGQVPAAGRVEHVLVGSSAQHSDSNKTNKGSSSVRTAVVSLNLLARRARRQDEHERSVLGRSLAVERFPVC